MLRFFFYRALLLLLPAVLGCGQRDAQLPSGQNKTEGTAGVAQPAASQPSTLSEQSKQPAGRKDTTVTFNKDIAPLAFEHCTPCHRPGQVAPFSLIGYDDFSTRAEQIADVTESRYMPPWKPAAGHETFADARLLESSDIELLRRWLEAGTPEGNAADLPPAPTYPTGWLLGEPDLVLKMSQSYELSAGGSDKFRSFVIPIPLDRVRYVRGLECRPSNARVIHHADILFDPTTQSRELDALDPVAGFEGMRPIESASVGSLTGWAPGATPILYPEELAWELDPSSDLVLTLHMLPTGKSEPVDFELGFYFTDKRPQRPSYLLRLASTTINIPAGEAEYEVSDEYTLPVDVELVGLRPHAHYLAKEVEVTATFPDSAETTLLKITDWDFNWQDDYRYQQAQLLPKGTRLSMRWVYDNSTANVRNPNSPPQSVRWGAKSSDEMGIALLQLIPFNTAEYRKLALDLQRKSLHKRIAGYEMIIRQEPSNLQAHSSLSHYYKLAKEKPEILKRLEQAQTEAPDDATLHYCLGTLHSLLGNDQQSIAQLEQALQIAPSYDMASYQLAQTLLKIGQMEKATTALQRVVEALPALHQAHYALGIALSKSDQLQQAITSFKKSLSIYPDQPLCQEQLGSVYMKLKEWKEAEHWFRTALETEPDSPHRLVNLAVAIQNQDRLDEALSYYKKALEVEPNAWQTHANLAGCYLLKREANPAIEHYQQAVRINPQAWLVRMKFGDLWSLVGEPAKAAKQFQAVAEGQHEFALAHLKTAQALKTAGQTEEALRFYRSANEIKPDWTPAVVGLAWILATHPDEQLRDPQKAIQLTEAMANAEKPHPVLLDTIAAAYAALEKFDQAMEFGNKALQVASSAGMNELAKRIEKRLRLYRDQKPFVEKKDADPAKPDGS